MTCQVVIARVDGHVTKVWGLLVCASSTFFTMVCLVQWIPLSHWHERVHVMGIVGDEHTLCSLSIMTFEVTNL